MASPFSGEQERSTGFQGRSPLPGTTRTRSFVSKRVAHLMGYEKVITYTLEEESGGSLRAVGAEVVGQVQPKEWGVPSRPRENQAVSGKATVKWEL
jgi:hypothetical protein